jgi:hypothetical protein
MNLGTVLVLVAAILAVIEMVAYWRVSNWGYHWLLSFAVLIGFVGVLLGAAPIPTK